MNEENSARLPSKPEIVVAGGGLAGYATAIAFASEGFDTVLLAPAASHEDGRSTALIGGSVGFLKRIGVFDRLEAEAAPLAEMRIVDDTNRLLRAPTLSCRASEIGLAAFGFNVLNQDIMVALQARACELSDRLTTVHAAVATLVTSDEGVSLELDDGRTVAASLVVGADGRKSVVREQAGIGLRRWSYPQSAVVLNISHRLDHGGVSTEFHRRTGPFTQVPLLGRRSSLVWVEDPQTAELVVDLKPEPLAAMIEARMHSILGEVQVESPAQQFPLSGASASRLSAQRVALVGEAAHVFPPIGAQGLNLGLRDAAAIVAAAAEHRDDPGSRICLAGYDANRRLDVLSRTLGVDLLNRSLLAGFLPAQMARAAGLSAMASVPFLRRFAMREGLSPGAGFAGVRPALRHGIEGVA